MGSGGSKEKKGGNWKPRIYFDRKADKKVEAVDSYIRIYDDVLKKNLEGIGIEDGEIIKVTIYKKPLFEVQFSNLILYHAFVVLETDKWWWSLEKNADGIVYTYTLYVKSVKDILTSKKYY